MNPPIPKFLNSRIPQLVLFVFCIKNSQDDGFLVTMAPDQVGNGGIVIDAVTRVKHFRIVLTKTSLELTSTVYRLRCSWERHSCRARPGATEARECLAEKNPVWARDNRG